MAELTDEQAAIYDRQIRVWGADVQRRLTEAKVLMLGCTPLASEVAKNFVLAGVGQLTVVDDSPATEAPLTFLSSPKMLQKGTSSADMFAAGLQELNPMVAVKTAPGAATELPDPGLLKQQHLVLAFGLHAGQQSELNALCREHAVSLIAARSFGGNAVAFVDLIVHTCKLPERGEDAKAEQATIEYQTLHEAANTSWSYLSAHDRRRLNPLLPAWAVLSAFEIERGAAARSSHFDSLDAQGQERESEARCKTKLWHSAALQALLEPGAGVPAVDAIVGGFLGNDVVRALSHVGVPTHNVLCFSMSDNVAQMHNLTGKRTVRAG